MLKIGDRIRFANHLSLLEELSEQTRHIELLNVADGYVNLDVDGKTLRIPLPEGYRVYTREEYPESYNFFYGYERREISLPLCGLINIDDHERWIKSSHSTQSRTAYLEIERVFIPHRFSLSRFHTEMQTEKDNDKIFALDKKKFGGGQV